MFQMTKSKLNTSIYTILRYYIELQAQNSKFRMKGYLIIFNYNIIPRSLYIGFDCIFVIPKHVDFQC